MEGSLLAQSNGGPLVSVIFPMWNSRKFVFDCIESIERNCGVPHEVIAVDNGSTDGAPEEVAGRYPAVQIIRNGRNLGPAPAWNQGIRVARGRYILILDVDTVLHPGAVPSMLQFLREYPEVGLVAPKLVYADGSLQLSCGELPTAITKFARLFPNRITNRLLAREEYWDWPHDQVRSVDYVLGAFHLLPRTVLERVGELDERLFYATHDLDYCLRVRLAGFDVVYVPLGMVTHRWQRLGSKIASRKFFAHLLCLIRYFRKHGYILRRRSVKRRVATTYHFPMGPGGESASS